MTENSDSEISSAEGRRPRRERKFLSPESRGLLIFLLTGALTFVAGLLAGGATIWLYGHRLESFLGGRPQAPRESRQGGYTLINPLLECDVATNNFEKRELTRFEHKVHELVAKLIETGRARSISVYFNDLNNGPWFGINEKERFAPASLNKLPVLIAYLKLAERDPSILSRSYTMTAAALQGPEHIIPHPQSLVPGRKYTVSELLRLMIVFSDNSAARLLIQDVREHFERPFIDLHLPVPSESRFEDFMDVKSYASFFRILYNASYLSNEMSENALRLLLQPEFRHGLVSGVAPGVPVAHKYGEWVIPSPGPEPEKPLLQFHDCGIVYFPQRPYVLCVMTRGDDLAELLGSIREVSREVYRAVDAQRTW